MVGPDRRSGRYSSARSANAPYFFPLWKRGMKGDLAAFQKADLLGKIQKRVDEKNQESRAALTGEECPWCVKIRALAWIEPTKEEQKMEEGGGVFLGLGRSLFLSF